LPDAKEKTLGDMEEKPHSKRYGGEAVTLKRNQNGDMEEKPHSR
jgi:hypothetical protein